MKEFVVIKKDGRKEIFEFNKIINAVKLSAIRIGRDLKEDFIIRLETEVSNLINKENLINNEVAVEILHNIVEKALYTIDKDLFISYSSYRDYKRKQTVCIEEQNREVENILLNGDKENANKDSMLNSTQKELIGGIVSKNYALNFELPKAVADAHEKGFIYVHDLRDFIFGGINCCLFDMGKVMKDGFELNGVKYREPGSISSAIDIMADLIISASSQQFGGFTVPEPDKFLAPYCEKSYNKYLKEANKWNIADAEKFAEDKIKEDLLQGFDGIDHKLNTINNALGQTPFVTISFGLGTGKWERMISRSILEVRMKGLGKNGLTAVFPKLVFLHRAEVNGNIDSPNFDLKQLAIRCSMKRLYPDFLSLDGGYLGEVYDESKIAISPMGKSVAHIKPCERFN